MKLLLGTIALLGATMLMTPASAALLIDDFDGAGAQFTITKSNATPTPAAVTRALNDGRAGTRTVSLGGALAARGNLTLGGGGFSVNALNANGITAVLAYDFAAPIDLHSSGPGLPFGSPLVANLVDDIDTIGSWTLTASYVSTLFGTASFTPIAFNDSGNSGELFTLVGSSLGRGALASSVNRIVFSFTTNGPGSIGVTGASITAVPEPASMAVLGVLGLGGVIARRRRVSKVAA